MIVKIAVSARQNVVQITRYPGPCTVGKMRRYRNISPDSLARLQRVAPLAPVTEGPMRGALTAKITKA